MKRLITGVLVALVLWCVLPIAYAVKVENTDTYIESKDFHCEPIFNAEGECLVRGWADIKVKDKDRTAEVEIRYKDIDKALYTEKGTTFLTESTKKAKDKADKAFKKDELTRVYFDFWTSVSGEFDVVVDGFVLHPYYNITINATTPSIHLINGTLDAVDDNAFDTLVDITSGLSDGSDTTTYPTTDSICSGTATACSTYGTNLTCSEQDGCSWSGSSAPTDWIFKALFDGHSNSTEGEEPIAETGTTFVSGFNGQAIYIEGTDELSYNATGNLNDTGMTIMVFLNPQVSVCNNGVNNYLFFWASDVGNNEILFQCQDNDRFRCKFEGGGTSVTATSYELQSANATWHTVACTWDSATGNVTMYIDGVWESEDVVSSNPITAIDSHFEVGHRSGADTIESYLDDFVIYPYALTGEQIVAINSSTGACSGTATTCPSYNVDEPGCENQDGCSFTTAKAIRPFFNYTVDNRSWLRVRKTTTGVDEFRVYSYINSTTINTTNFIDYSITTGWDIIPLDGLVDVGYNNPFRFYATSSHENVSEVQFIVEQFQNETDVPSVTDCLVNNTELTCTDTVRFSCNVTDASEIDQVWYNMSAVTNVVQEADKIINTTIYYIDQSYDFDGNFDGLFAWVNASDQFGNYNFTQLDLPFNYTCDFAEYINITHSGVDGVDQINITISTVFIEWTTSNPSNSTVVYGTSPTNLSSTTAYGALVTSHSVFLSGLSSSTTYFYNVSSAFNPEQELGIFNFTTLLGIDTTAPNVDNCAVNSSVLTCGDTLRMTCDVVEPDSSVASVVFDWTDNVTNSASASVLVNDTYYIDRTYTDSAIWNGSFTFVNATNPDGYYNETALSLGFNYSCCVENWVNITEITSCSQDQNQSQLLWFNDTNACGTNATFPVGNGTTSTINCTPSILYTLRTGQCPDTTPGVLILGIFVAVALFLVALSFGSNSSIPGLFGSFLFVVLSWIMVGCHALLATILGMMGLVFIVYFVVKKNPVG